MTDSEQRRFQIPWAARGLTLTFAAWAVLASVELVLLLWSDQSRRLLGPFSVLDQATLVSAELTALVLAAILVGWPVARLSALAESRDGGPLRIAARGAAIVWAGLASLALVSSWLTFLMTGEFLNWAGVRLWMASPVQMVQHGIDFQAGRLLLVPLLVGAGAVVLGYVLPVVVDRWDGPDRKGFNRKVGLLVTICFTVTVWGETRALLWDVEVSDPQAGRVYSPVDYYHQTREEETGPAFRAVAEAWQGLTGGPHGLEPSDALSVTRDSILPPGRYGRMISDDSTGSERYNVILVLVESLRPDQLAAYGSTRAVMPHVDSVAAEGRVYLDNYTQSSHSNYADLAPLSSHYPLRSEQMHVYPENPPYPRTLIYDLLSEAGYRTAIFSSQNENWGGMIHYLETAGLDTLFHSETFEGGTYIPEGDPGFAGYAATTGRAGKIDDRYTVDAAIDWIRGDATRPFFMYMNLQNSHIPYRTPEGFRRFGPDSVDFTIHFGPMPAEKIDVVKDVYANSLAYIDVQLGRLFAELRRSGRWEHTIVILSGDTGQAFLEHGFLAHAGDLYNEVLKVPLVVRAPNLEPGRDSTPAEHVDVPPTILDLLGLPRHPGFQGRSLLDPTVQAPRARFLVAQSPLAHQYAVVVGDWKLIHDVRSGASLLFDLGEDSTEQVNLAEERPEVVERLRGILGTWSESQIDYYRTPALYNTWYPPKYRVTEVEPSSRTAVAEKR